MIYSFFNIARKYFVIVIMLLILSTYQLYRATAAASEVKRYTVRIVQTLPHNPQSFTQGLVYDRGSLYESTGLYGQSSLQQIDAQTGVVRKVLPVPGVFAEGLTRWENRLIQLTWQEQTAFIYNLTDFSKIGAFQYDTEGWGLTADEQYLIMSDGTDVLYFRDPVSFETVRAVHVTFEGKPLERLNELEYIQGLIYANVWYEDFIVQINPADGAVTGWIDASSLRRMQPPLNADSVLNGIAYRAETNTLYLTGKNWPVLFEVTLVQGF